MASSSVGPCTHHPQPTHLVSRGDEGCSCVPAAGLSSVPPTSPGGGRPPAPPAAAPGSSGTPFTLGTSAAAAAAAAAAAEEEEEEGVEAVGRTWSRPPVGLRAGLADTGLTSIGATPGGVPRAAEAGVSGVDQLAAAVAGVEVTGCGGCCGVWSTNEG